MLAGPQISVLAYHLEPPLRASKTVTPQAAHWLGGGEVEAELVLEGYPFALSLPLCYQPLMWAVRPLELHLSSFHGCFSLLVFPSNFQKWTFVQPFCTPTLVQL